MYVTHSQIPALWGIEFSSAGCQQNTKSEFTYTMNFRVLIQGHVQYSHFALGGCQVDASSVHKQIRCTDYIGSLQLELGRYSRSSIQHAQIFSLPTEQLFNTSVKSPPPSTASRTWHNLLTRWSISTTKLFLDFMRDRRAENSNPAMQEFNGRLGWFFFCFLIKDWLLLEQTQILAMFFNR